MSTVEGLSRTELAHLSKTDFMAVNKIALANVIDKAGKQIFGQEGGLI